MVDNIQYVVDPDSKFKKEVQAAAAKCDDLTIPFIAITKSWYQGNKAIFSLKSAGKYTDYKVSKKLGYSPYAHKKEKMLGSPYPMLRGFTRKLEMSLTEASNENAINQIVNKKSLILGTRVPYAAYNQLGTKFAVARPFMFIGAEQQAPTLLQQRRDTWVLILRDYVKKSTERMGYWR